MRYCRTVFLYIKHNVQHSGGYDDRRRDYRTKALECDGSQRFGNIRISTGSECDKKKKIHTVFVIRSIACRTDLIFFKYYFARIFLPKFGRSVRTKQNGWFFSLSFLRLPTLSRNTYLNGNVYRTTSDQIFYTPPTVFSIYRTIDDRINIYLKNVYENLFVFVDRLADVVTKTKTYFNVDGMVPAGSTLEGILKNFQGRSKGGECLLLQGGVVSWKTANLVKKKIGTDGKMSLLYRLENDFSLVSGYRQYLFYYYY